MALPERPTLPPYAGEVRFGVVPSPTIDALSTAYREMAVPAIIPVPSPDALPAPPAECDWISPVSDWEVLGNDRIGDCVPACMAHAVESITDAAGARTDVTLNQTIRAYSDLTGYNPATGVPDPGVVIGQAMGYWTSTGIGGHKILSSTFSNAIGHPVVYQRMIQRSVYFYGCSILSLAIPSSAVAAFYAGQPWTEGMGGSTTSHCVPALAYDDQWCEIVTWGRPLRVSWGFIRERLTELWAIYSPEWIRPDGTAPCGLGGDRLMRRFPTHLSIIAG